MIVKELLNLIEYHDNVKILQMPIKALNNGYKIIERQCGECTILLNSNNNYLNFEILNIKTIDNIINICCIANKEQENKIIKAHNS